MLVGIFPKNKSAVQEHHSTKNLDKDFIQLFHEQASNNPHHIAIVTENESLTYNELNKKSDQLAQYLIDLGIQTEDRIGLCASVSANFIICMLGIIKAGAVYFPLDPAYPKDRLEYMIKDGKPSMILAEPEFIRLFKHNQIITINKDIFKPKINSESIYKKNHSQSEKLAYIIYTSGSTGKPKGIMVTHKSLPNIALAHNDYYPSNLRMLISGGVCFDASLLVVFHALVNNESLYLYNYSPKDSIDGLINFIKKHSINFMISVPSQYLKILEKNCQFPFFKCISLTGENLPRNLCNLHAKLAPNAILYNEYGPTECAIGTTIAKIYDPKYRIIRQITVGKPLPNTQVYILDQNLNRVPKGALGEICIGGIGLAQGYLNNEKLTSEKFVWITIPRKKPLRLYRTGDIGRFLPNGNLEFLGRIDQKVQIGGNWINLGEIEYHISRNPDIKESAIVINSNHQGEKHLVAYITSSKKTAARSLHTYLKGLVPKHMIPSFIKQIDKFPMSPNGKIDRDALVRLHG